MKSSGSRFVARFRPLRATLSRVRAVSPEQSFVVRLLMVHEYRRILLHDSDLPLEVLPRDWPGLEARRLAAEIYHIVATASVDFIRARLEGAGGPMPAPAESFTRRFGA